MKPALAAVLLLAAPLAAQLLPARQFAAAYAPNSLAAGDLDGDGRVDLVAGGDDVAVLLRDPAGGFLPAALYPADDAATSVALGHLDGDDALDVVWCRFSFSLPTLSWRLGDVTGGFGAASSLPVAVLPESIAVDDFDGDGDEDVAVTSLTTNLVTILRSNGVGGLSPAGTVPTGASPQWIASGDLDGDDDIDLVVANSQADTLTVLRGNGAGGFTPSAPLPAPDDPREVLIGDVDEDGDADLLVSATPSVALFLGHDDGTFAAFQFLDEWGSALQLADVDGNGFQDLVDIGPDGIRALPGGEGPAFGSPPPSVKAGEIALTLAVLEVNGDGQPDIVVGSYGSQHVTSLLNTGFGEFQSYDSQPFHLDATDFVATDLDGDTDVDVAIAAYGYFKGSGVSVLHNDGAGTLGREEHTDLEPQFDIAAGDVDADGDIDLASTSEYDNVKVQLNDGSGSFPVLTNVPVGGFLDAPGLGDLDGDGDADLAVNDDPTSPATSAIAVALADGTGKFAAPVKHHVAAATGIALADLDLDGALDITTAGTSPGLVQALLGDGAGGFPGIVTSPLPDGTTGLAVGDLDSDGDPDLVTLSLVEGDPLAALTALHGNGAGGFAVAQSWPVDALYRDLALADLDGNGWPEILTVQGPQAGSVMLLMADGAGGFLPPRFHVAGTSPYAVAVAPFDADDRPDVLVLDHTTFTDGEITVLRNLGPPESWTNLGEGKFGVAGIPMLVGHGTLQAGKPMSLELRGARPLSAATLVIGLSPLFAPLKGGVLVPQPNFVFPGLSTGVDGGLLLQADWPSGIPSDLQTWYQFWVKDLGGFAASNGVTAVAP